MSNWNTEIFTVLRLSENIKNKTIKVPHYQRGQVWRKSQKEKLIDSIKKGFPIGTILLYKKSDNTYQLIDGLQRSATLYEYLNSPIEFFDESDLSDESLNNIYDLLKINNNKEATKKGISKNIKNWVHKNYSANNSERSMSVIDCTKYLMDQYSINDKEVFSNIGKIIENEFELFKKGLDDLSHAEIPAIVYTGSPNNLPEIFNRINSKGITLSKYQILSAIWSTREYLLLDDKLYPIIDYVDKFYVSLFTQNFDVDGYDEIEIRQTKKLNLYQILFGFSKMLSNNYPYLFKSSKSNRDIESSGFNLVNACLGNKNNKIADLPEILNDTFNNDNKKISRFFVNIIDTVEKIDVYLKPYIAFKLNRRNKSINIYHTELQICSMIANYFINNYVTFTYDKYSKIASRTIETEHSKNNFDYENFEEVFKNNALKKYLIDIINNNWGGTGDKRLDDSILNTSYYTENITKDIMENELDHWFNQMNSRNETKTIGDPKAAEKIMLNIIYCHSFSSYEQNSDLTFDIEHLAPKGCMKILLNTLSKRDNEQYGLPISSFANLCLLPEEINRKKKEKTLYQDNKYLKSIKNKNVSINDVENKFSFTTEKDLEWINEEYEDYNELRKNYFNFLNIRFKKQKEIILKNLYNEKYALNDNKNIEASKNYSSYIGHDDVNQYSGWKKDVFDIVDSLDEYFTLEQVYQYCDHLRQLYPKNKNIEAGIRRTLQYMRNDGLIEFIDRGKYKKL